MTDAFIHPTAIVAHNALIGQNVRIWHFCHVMDKAQIGENSVLGQNVMIGPNVKLGKNCKVQNNVSVYAGVTCEDDVFLGPSMVFTNVFNPRSAIERKNEFKPTLVKKGATIGANATILCGITIHEYAFIGAGAVVTHNVPPYALVFGNPAKQNGWMSQHGCKLVFSNQKIAICPESGTEYILNEQGNVEPRTP
jgi:UDP-2-acetamido-3-amino-2,3-dideoxy-glucuronate N-acetyltransferase